MLNFLIITKDNKVLVEKKKIKNELNKYCINLIILKNGVKHEKIYNSLVKFFDNTIKTKINFKLKTDLNYKTKINVIKIDEKLEINPLAKNQYELIKFSEIVVKTLSFFVQKNLEYLIKIFNDVDYSFKEKLEKEIIIKYNLQKKNDRVFYTKSMPSNFFNIQITFLLYLATIKKIDLFRLCLHKTDNDTIHEMLMFHTKPQFVGPLRQFNKTSLSYYAIRGSAIIKLYDKDGRVDSEYEIDSENQYKSKFCRLNANKFRSIESLTDNFVFIETCSGPFEDNDTIWYCN